MSSYLAIDIGASGGRHMLLEKREGRLVLTEVYRFENQAVERDGHLYWDTDQLLEQVLLGMEQAAQGREPPVSVGIDTWGVDYVLLGPSGERIGDVYAYRDARTVGMQAALEALLSPMDQYTASGIQPLSFNTVYQLMADRAHRPQVLEEAQRLLLLPEYLMYRLTGRALHEVTNASTTALLQAQSRDWNWALLDRLGIPRRLFGRVHAPGEVAGTLLPGIRERVGYDARVVLPPSHDTASAVLAAPLFAGSLFLSSGTWSLLGLEAAQPDLREECLRRGFTNERGYGGTYRFLKNIMGLWMIQSLRREEAKGRPYPELTALARQAGGFPGRVDVEDASFFAPRSMAGALDSYCAAHGQAVPQTLGQRLACVYHSLAAEYARSIRDLEALTGRSFDRLAIVGGGSRDAYLNQLTADASGKIVTAGPVEATALGNGIAQMLADGIFGDKAEARACIAQSFPIQTFEPGGITQ